MNAKKSRKSPTAPTTNGQSDFVVTGELAVRLAEIAEKLGINPEKLAASVVSKYLERLESAPAPAAAEYVLTPNQTDALKRFKLDGAEMVQREIKDGIDNVRALADSMEDLPETPALDRLTRPECIPYEHALQDESGIRIPTPGLLGEVEIPRRVAMDAMARTLVNFEMELMRLAVEKHPSLKKEVADVLLVAENIFIRWDGSGAEAVRSKGEESIAQLFARWAGTGTDFAEFESIVAEQANRTRVKLNHERARQRDCRTNGVAA